MNTPAPLTRAQLGTIIVTPLQAEKVKSARTKLTGALSGKDRVRQRSEALRSRLVEINGELTRKGDALDLTFIEKRRALREQAAAIEVELSSLDPDELPSGAVRANAAALGLVMQILRPTLEPMIEKITTVLVPFFEHPSFARQAAGNTDVIRNFGAFLNCDFAQGATAESCGQTVKFLDALLAGRNPGVRQ